MFHPTVSPHDSRIAVVGSDMTGDYISPLTAATHGASSASAIRSGIRRSTPATPTCWDATTGILYRSPDLGASWKPVLPRPAAIRKVTTGDDHASEYFYLSEGPPADVSAFTIDPADSKSLYAAVGTTLWYSYDTGGTWTQIANLAGNMSALWIDPRSLKGERTLYAARGSQEHNLIRRDGKWSSRRIAASSHRSPLPFLSSTPLSAAASGSPRVV